MKKIKKLSKSRAVSPVIATVILVAVTITVAVAVSYWMSSIAGQYTTFEKVEIQSAYAEIQPSPGGWIITLEMKNSGSATANLIRVFVNEKPIDLYGSTFDDTQVDSGTIAVPTGDAGNRTGTNILVTGVAIESGKTADVDDTTTDPDPIQVYIGSKLFSSGTTINIKIHSAAGMDYIKLVQLT
ncbi:hypothetical protein ES703_120897 [subsurface metagenome]